MAKNKTAETDKNVKDFINEFADTEQKKTDSFELIELMKKITGYEARMWGPSIIGFGKYHYKYASGHEGDAPLWAFHRARRQFHFMFIQDLMNINFY